MNPLQSKEWPRKSSGPHLTRRLGNRRSLKHQLAHVFHRRAAVGNHLVVVFFEIEIFAELFLLSGAKIEVFSGADKVGGKMRRSEPGAFPFCNCFTFLLK